MAGRGAATQDKAEAYERTVVISPSRPPNTMLLMLRVKGVRGVKKGG